MALINTYNQHAKDPHYSLMDLECSMKLMMPLDV